MKNKKLNNDWELENIFGYKDIEDSAIDSDIQKGIVEIKQFVKDWKDRKDWLVRPSILKLALDQYTQESAADKAIYYLYLKQDINLSDSSIKGKLELVTEKLKKASEEILFFTLRLGKVDSDKQAEFLASDELVEYHYYLSDLFENAQYHLTQPEERILSRTSTTRSSLWGSSLAKAIGTSTVIYKNKELTLPEASNKISGSHDREVRHDLHNLVINQLQNMSILGEPVMNAIAKNRQTSDELRGYTTPYEATVKGYGNTTEELEGLIEVVSNKFSIAKDFYNLSKKMLGYDCLGYADRSASIGSVNKTFDIQSSREIISQSLTNFDPATADRFINYFEEGRVDVFPKQGKRGGAYQLGTSQESLGNFILLNHTDSFNDFMTLAHEFGHALHSELATESQPTQYRGYSTSTAETASTFIEQLIFYDILPTLSEHDQKIALHDKMINAISTIFRQIAFVNFENKFHAAVREQGYVSHDDFANMMNESVGEYLGDAVELTDADGSFYVNLASSHLGRPYYVYSYAYGELNSMALYEIYKEDPNKGREAMETFMSLGSSMKPKDIFAAAGIEVGPKLWKKGLQQLQADLEQLGELHKK